MTINAQNDNDMTIDVQNDNSRFAVYVGHG